MFDCEQQAVEHQGIFLTPAHLRPNSSLIIFFWGPIIFNKHQNISEIQFRSPALRDVMSTQLVFNGGFPHTTPST